MSAQNLGLDLPLRLSGTGFVLDANGHIVGDGVYGKGAEGIVLACNSHAELVAALEAAEKELTADVLRWEALSKWRTVDKVIAARDNIRAALSRAKG